MRRLAWWFLALLLRPFYGPFFGTRCDHCGFPLGEIDYDSSEIRIERSGFSFDGDRRIYWYEGTFPCPRCRHRIWFGDSN